MVVNADLCVIGAGSAGLSVAAGAAMLGVPVVLIEKARMGGDCLNTGCVPSKALLAAAHAAQAVRGAGRFGIAATIEEIDQQAARAHVQRVIDAIAPVDSVARFEALGVTVLQGEARFTSARDVRVGDTAVRARRIVVATGSVPAVPPVPGLDRVPYFTNETIFESDEILSHLIVVGAGPIGLEMAQAHRRLGIDVTVLEMARALPKDDPETAAVVATALKREGVVIHEAARVTAVDGEAGRIRVTVESEAGSETVTGSHLLIAAGRQPSITGLDLDKAGIAAGPGGIQVDARLRTTNKRVFAIGDVAGGPQFTHVAGYHAGIVIKNALFRIPAKAVHENIPWVTFTDPELAHVGLTAEAAQQRHGTVRVLRWPFSENDRAQAEGRIDGLIKAVATKRGRILGVSIAGARAGEIIQPWVLAINEGLSIAKLANSIVPYPTFGEVSKRAAGSFYTPSLFSPRVRRLVRFLAKFG